MSASVRDLVLVSDYRPGSKMAHAGGAILGRGHALLGSRRIESPLSFPLQLTGQGNGARPCPRKSGRERPPGLITVCTQCGSTPLGAGLHASASARHNPSTCVWAQTGREELQATAIYRIFKPNLQKIRTTLMLASPHCCAPTILRNKKQPRPCGENCVGPRAVFPVYGPATRRDINALWCSWGLMSPHVARRAAGGAAMPTRSCAAGAS